MARLMARLMVAVIVSLTALFGAATLAPIWHGALFIALVLPVGLVADRAFRWATRGAS